MMSFEFEGERRRKSVGEKKRVSVCKSEKERRGCCLMNVAAASMTQASM